MIQQEEESLPTILLAFLCFFHTVSRSNEQGTDAASCVAELFRKYFTPRLPHCLPFSGPAVPHPPERLRVFEVTLFPVHNDGDNAVQLTVFAKEALTVQVSRIDVPDAHEVCCDKYE